MKKITIHLMIIILLTPCSLMAYIDPGSGSAILSAIVGILVAGGLFIKTYWYKLKSLVTRKSKEADTKED
jgi:hypothetical protein